MASSVTVSWDTPSELEASIEKNVKFLIHLCPDWVNHLSVRFNSQPDESDRTTTAYIEADYKYRRVVLTICPTWVVLTETERKHTLVHEAVHILTAPVQQFVKETMDELLRDDAAALRVVQANWRIANESTTEDLTNTILAMSDASWNAGFDDALDEYGLSPED